MELTLNSGVIPAEEEPLLDLQITLFRDHRFNKAELVGVASMPFETLISKASRGEQLLRCVCVRAQRVIAEGVQKCLLRPKNGIYIQFAAMDAQSDREISRVASMSDSSDVSSAKRGVGPPVFARLGHAPQPSTINSLPVNSGRSTGIISIRRGQLWERLFTGIGIIRDLTQVVAEVWEEH